MWKAVVVAALGGMLSGHWIRNGWLALVLLMGLVIAETGVEAVRHHWKPLHDIGNFALVDTVGSTALLLSEALSG
jgi:high-affinity nickel permease